MNILLIMELKTSDDNVYDLNIYRYSNLSD